MITVLRIPGNEISKPAKQVHCELDISLSESGETKHTYNMTHEASLLLIDRQEGTTEV